MTKWLVILTGGVCWFYSGVVWAHPFTIDQANDLGPPPGALSIPPFSPIGQEFTPTLSSLDVVELTTNEGLPGTPGNGIGADLFVRIRSGSIIGTILGTSSTVSLPDPSDFTLELTHFDFPSSVPLTPGDLHVIEVVQSGGDPRYLWTANSFYPGGVRIVNGLGEPDRVDFWFREGPVSVPEPSALLLLGSGLAGLALWKRRT